MKIIQKFLLGLLLIGGILGVVGCTSNTPNNPDNPNNPNNPDDPNNPNNPGDDQTDETGYTYEGTKTVAPYTVYNEDGSVAEEFENLYLAIQYAGEIGLSSNKVYVKDGNELEIFRRTSRTTCYMFDGEYYVGSDSQAKAIEWSEGRPRSYVFNGQGTDYTHLGREFFEGTDESQDIPFELFSGGYNYMFSKSGETDGVEWIKPGFGYMETIVRMSEAHYMPTQDGKGWNAYVFINVGTGYTCDLGLIGNLNSQNGLVEWRLCRNCQHESHGGNGFTVVNPGVNVTTMSYNEETKDYTGADDLKFQVWGGVDGYKLVITNLTTNQEYKIDETHVGSNVDQTQYLRFLLAASYCPVVGHPWNARSGAYLKDVIFEDAKIARYEADGTYADDVLEEFYPGADNFNYGFSQGADCASALFGTYEKDGTYANGASYSAGSRWINFSSYYDGSHHNNNYKN